MKLLALIGLVMIVAGAVLLYTSGRTGTNVAILVVGVFILFFATPALSLLK